MAVPAIKNHSITYSPKAKKGKPPPPATANDLHVKFTKEVEILGVDGVDPESPNASFDMKPGKGGGIDFSGFSKKSGASITIRTKSKEETKIKSVHWTFDGAEIKNSALFALADEEGDDADENGEPASDDVEEVIFDMNRKFIKVIDVLNQLVNSVDELSEVHRA